jgi:hypothetical protein
MIRSLALLVAASALVGPTGLRAGGGGAAQPDSRDVVAIAAHTHKVLIDNDLVPKFATSSHAGNNLGCYSWGAAAARPASITSRLI